MYKNCVKRCLDLLLSLCGILVLSPVLLVLCVLVRVKLGSPVLFRQERPGKNERIFTLCKFRTMTDEKDENGRYIRRERYSGSCQRSFYVGKDVTQEEIKARFENGILKLTVPKKEALPKTEEKRYISIDG